MFVKFNILGWSIAILALFSVVINASPSLSAQPALWLSALGPYESSWHDATTAFWDKAKRAGISVQKYTEAILHNAVATYPAAASGIADMKLSMEHVIQSTGALKDDVIKKHGKSVDQMSAIFAQEMSLLSAEIKKEFPHPDHADHHAERSQLVAKVLTKVEEGVVRASMDAGIPEHEARVHFQAMKPHIQNVIVTIGDLIEQHPLIAETLLFAGVGYLIPEAWILKHVFGIFGFGPSGTIKGSTAAWAQSRFFGAVIPAGSWFSRLQSASMGGVGTKIGVGIGAGVGLGLGFMGKIFSCGGR